MTDDAVLNERLSTALADVTVEPGARRAFVGPTVLRTDSARALRAQLSDALYATLHAGHGAHRARPSGEQPRARTVRDHDFEARLARCVPHRHTRARGVLLGTSARGPIVRLADVTVLLSQEQVVGTLPAPGHTVDLVLDAARPVLSPGFFYVHGSRLTLLDGPVRRVYLHITTASAAPGILATTVAVLERRQARYHLKVLSAPDGFPRRDALVIYLPPDGEAMAQHVAAALTGHPGIGSDTSVLAAPLAPGVCTAWEPSDPRAGMRGMSFGQHRSFAIAEGLVAHATDPSPGHRAAAVAHALRAADIDPLEPARNLSG
ncbi:T3SS effector HopA1 family protein [Kitasatospora sp. NPDC059827]|uniref:T3SS effector HopA1 family protein n=1 Tax=Kitasatospora sp. NPDC059827 TaxID=3346964 RepID=UPI00364E5827